MTKLTETNVRAILADKRSQEKIALDYGVSQVQISHIKLRRAWTHIQEVKF